MPQFIEFPVKTREDYRRHRVCYRTFRGIAFAISTNCLGKLLELGSGKDLE